MGAVEKIESARRFETKEWLLDGFNKLLQHAYPVTDEEAEHLGLKTVTKVAHLRERHLINQSLPAVLRTTVCHDCCNTLGENNIYCRPYCSCCGPNRSEARQIGVGTQREHSSYPA